MQSEEGVWLLHLRDPVHSPASWKVVDSVMELSTGSSAHRGVPEPVLESHEDSGDEKMAHKLGCGLAGLLLV